MVTHTFHPPTIFIIFYCGPSITKKNSVSGTLESPISEEGIDAVEESEVGWSGETVILTPLNNNYNTTYACTGKI